MSFNVPRALILLLTFPAGLALSLEPLPAQVGWQDLVFTGGVSAEGYRGNLPAVTVSAVDSTEEASAAVGEFGVRGRVFLIDSRPRTLSLQFDGGLRQFVAGGFRIRDYAPREWVGRLDMGYREDLGSWGRILVRGALGGRRVEDRPPMPLFIQPGYLTGEGDVRLQFRPVGGVSLDAQFFGESADYASTDLTPQLDLLDREILGAEVGAVWGRTWTIRLHSAFRATRYRHQGTFDPDDPFRRDRALSLGATWTFTGRTTAQLGIEGTINRSNSSRPEYDALSARAVISLPLPHDLSLNFFALLTGKRYLRKSVFAQLVPGEEADNASVVYVELSRALALNLDGALRFGWNRAETDIGNSYFERFGATFLLRYRPWE